MKQNSIIVLIIVALVGMLGLSSVFTVNQYQMGLSRMFGKIARDAKGVPILYKPGLHLKIPIVEQVILLDGRIQTMDRPAERVGTSEKKDMMVDSFVKWRIKDFTRYFLRTQGQFGQATLLLEKIVNNGLRAEFGRHTIVDAIYRQRRKMMTNIREAANRTAPELGIEIVDVRVKQANLPEDVSLSVYNRMREERNRVATQWRSEGKKEATVIRAKANKKVTIIEANARLKASVLRANADAKAAGIYAKSYNQNPEFYDFIRSLEAYRKSFASGNGVIVVSPDNDFFRYFGQERPKKRR